MLFNVPQFIEVEDKVVGPLTAKQFGWLLLGGVFVLIAWGTLDSSGFVVVTIVVAAIFGALAFYRPYNQPLIKFIFSGFSFITRPKMYIWKRDFQSVAPTRKKPAEKKQASVQGRKVLSADKLSEISKILDQKGRR